jgi:hypothetical protein
MKYKILKITFLTLLVTTFFTSCENENSIIEPVYEEEEYCQGYFNDNYMNATLINEDFNINKISRHESHLNFAAYTSNDYSRIGKDTKDVDVEGGWWFSIHNLDLEYIKIPCIIDLLRDENGKINAYLQIYLTEPDPQFHMSNILNIVADTILSDDYFYIFLDKYENNYLKGSFKGSYNMYTVKDGEFNLKIKRVYDPEIELN